MKTFIFGLLFLISQFTVAQSRILEPEEVPRYLYRWVYIPYLQKMADEYHYANSLPFTIMTSGPLLDYYPRLVFRPIMKDLSHDPVDGLSVDMGDTLALLRIEIKPDARALFIPTPTKIPSISKLYDFDLIFSQHNGWMNDWIILNPASIRGFTADPYIVGLDLFQRLNKSRFDELKKDKDLQRKNPALWEALKKNFPILTRLRTYPKIRSKIPKLFLQDEKNVKDFDCGDLGS